MSILSKLRRLAAGDDLDGLLEDINNPPKQVEEEDHEMYTALEFTLAFNVEANNKRALAKVPPDQLDALAKTAFNGHGDHQPSGVNLVYNVLARAINRAMADKFKDLKDVKRPDGSPAWKYRNIQYNFPKGDAPMYAMSLNSSGSFDGGNLLVKFITKLTSSAIGKDEAKEVAEAVKAQLVYVADSVTRSATERLNSTYTGSDALGWEETFDGVKKFTLRFNGVSGQLVLKGSNGSQVTAERRDRVLARFSGRA